MRPRLRRLQLSPATTMTHTWSTVQVLAMRRYQELLAIASNATTIAIDRPTVLQ